MVRVWNTVTYTYKYKSYIEAPIWQFWPSRSLGQTPLSNGSSMGIPIHFNIFLDSLGNKKKLYIHTVPQKELFLSFRRAYWFLRSLGSFGKICTLNCFLPNQIIIILKKFVGKRRRRRTILITVSVLNYSSENIFVIEFSTGSKSTPIDEVLYPSHSDTNAADEDLVVKEAFFSVANFVSFIWQSLPKIQKCRKSEKF